MKGPELQLWINNFIEVMCEVSENVGNVVRSGRGQLILPADIVDLLKRNCLITRANDMDVFIFLWVDCIFLVEVFTGDPDTMRIRERT